MKFIVHLALLFTLVSCASNEIVEKTPQEKKADLYYGHGTQALLDQDYTTALSHLQKAAELAPKDTKVLNNLGMAYYFKGEVPRAISYLEKAIDADEKNSDARVNLAGIYFAQGRLDLAYQQYSMVSKDLVYQHQYRTYYNMALILEKQGRPSEARSLIARSLKENKEYCPAFYLEGKMNEKVLNWKAALESFISASKGQCYEEPAPHFAQAQMLMKLGRVPEAREKFEMVMEKFSRTPYFSLASQEMAKLRTYRSHSEDDFLQEARMEMEKLRERESKEPQTYQGSSF